MHRRSLLALLPAALAGCASTPTVCGPAVAVTLPLTMIEGGVACVPVLINGRQVLMVLDTGAKGTLITPEGAAALALGRDPQLYANIYGANGWTRTQNVLVDRLQFGPARRSNLSLIVAPVPFFAKVAVPPETPLVGLLGADSLSVVDIGFDLGSRQAILYPRGSCGMAAPDWAPGVVDLGANAEPTDDRLFVTAMLDGLPFRALLDTGASGTSIRLSSARRLGITDATLDAALKGQGDGVAGASSFETRTLTFKDLRLGALHVTAPRIMVHRLENTGEDEMTIGLDILGSRPLWLSLGQKRALLARRPSSTPPITAGSPA